MTVFLVYMYFFHWRIQRRITKRSQRDGKQFTVLLISTCCWIAHILHNISLYSVSSKIARQKYSPIHHLCCSKAAARRPTDCRVSTALAVAASFFGIRIVGKASDKGELEPLHKCRGGKRAIGQLWECMLKSGYSGGKVRIRHSGNPNAADILAQQIKNSFPNADIKIGENRGLCSYYAEKGGIPIGFES